VVGTDVRGAGSGVVGTMQAGSAVMDRANDDLLGVRMLLDQMDVGSAVMSARGVLGRAGEVLGPVDLGNTGTAIRVRDTVRLHLGVGGGRRVVRPAGAVGTERMGGVRLGSVAGEIREGRSKIIRH